MVMRACGISLYRTAVPLLLIGFLASAALFAMQEKVLAPANREADRLNRIIRSWAPLISLSAQQWVVGSNGDIYHYDLFDPRAARFSRLWVYHPDPHAWRLQTMAYADEARFAGTGGDGGGRSVWEGRQGWVREFNVPRKSGGGDTRVSYEPFAARAIPLEPPQYFKTEPPDPEQMTYSELGAYTAKLRASGADAVASTVALQRKLAFPLITVIMTLIAVPFAVTTGRRGALYGVGIGILIALVYWMALSVFGALGSGGLLAPMIAAWAPNVLFTALAFYMMLTVRT
jgi:lipopolysaccharide export LptBFGC system permease protein LptF